MSYNYRQTISDELAALVERTRGPLTLQDFTTVALAQACGESPVVAELRAEIERLHMTIRALGGGASLPPAPRAEYELSW